MKRVCVIGAGICGLMTIRHLKDDCEVTCYEMKKSVGGLWNAKEKTPQEFVEKHGYDFENIYVEMDSLVEFPLMMFKDFPMNQEHYDNYHIHWEKFLKYL